MNKTNQISLPVPSKGRAVIVRLGYPFYFLTFMGIWKVAGAIVLFIPGFPRLKEWVYAGLIFTYTGAAFSHFSVGEIPETVSPIILAGLTLVSWALRPARIILKGAAVSNH